MANFTKGKWANTETAFARFNTYRNKRTGARTFVTVGMELDQVAEVQGNTDEEAETNARLIAAAPDMYEALKLLQGALTEYRLRDIKKRFSLCVADAAASNALAKAEGR